MKLLSVVVVVDVDVDVDVDEDEDIQGKRGWQHGVGTAATCLALSTRFLLLLDVECKSDTDLLSLCLKLPLPEDVTA